MRRQAADQQLYTTGKALDLLVNARIMLDRRAGNTVNSGTTRAALRDALAANGVKSPGGPATTAFCQIRNG